MALRAAVIGVRHGHIGEFFAAVRDTPGVELAGIAEDLDQLRTEYEARWSAPGFASDEELLDRVQPDVVGLATVNAEKAGVAARCLERGIHVIADKPLVTDWAGLERLRAAVAAGRARLSMMLTCRYSPAYRAVYDLVQRGVLGCVVHLASFGPHRLRPETRGPWMLSDAQSGGALVDIGIHYLDLLRWYTGEEAASVAAAQGNLRFPQLDGFTDHGHALVTFPGGATGYASVDWLTPDAATAHGDYRLFVSGTRGVCELHPVAPMRLTLVTDDLPPHDVPLHPAGPTPSRDFLEALRDGRSPELSAEDVLCASALTLHARDAATTGAVVRPTVA